MFSSTAARSATFRLPRGAQAIDFHEVAPINITLQHGCDNNHSSIVGYYMLFPEASGRDGFRRGRHHIPLVTKLPLVVNHHMANLTRGSGNRGTPLSGLATRRCRRCSLAREIRARSRSVTRGSWRPTTRRRSAGRRRMIGRVSRWRHGNSLLRQYRWSAVQGRASPHVSAPVLSTVHLFAAELLREGQQ